MDLSADDCDTVTPAGTFSVRNALPDAHMELVLVSPQGAISAADNPLDMPFADYFRVRDGKIVAQEVIWDQMTLMSQLRAMPPG